MTRPTATPNAKIIRLVTSFGAALAVVLAASPDVGLRRAWAQQSMNNNNPQARAACAKALAKGDLDALRVTWTIWHTRDVSQTIEIKKGKLARYGGLKKNQRSERDLSAAEKGELLAALRAARVDKLVWVNRDVKDDRDRVLNVDVLRPDGGHDDVGAFVRTSLMWNRAPTNTLVVLLEKWLAPDGK